MTSIKLRMFVALVIVTTLSSGVARASDTQGEVTLYRDNWGVPYIHASTDADAAYGLGYAQAEDRLEGLFMNVRTAVGRMAEVYGPDWVTQDYAIRVAKNAKRCEAAWEDIPDELKAIGESFMRGVNKYMEEHPDRVPESALELQPWHSIAIGQAMILNWPLNAIQDEINNTVNSKDFGSNQWSVSPSRTEDKCSILLTDPHLTWEGLAVFYEAHVFGDTLEMHGFFLTGTPLLALGHNANVGWAATTGGPDTADVFEITLNPDNPTQYKYDGEWRQAKIEFIKINVKGEKPVTRPAAYTHLGPLFAEPNYAKGTAYVGATPYLETTGLLMQSYKMCQAKNTDELYEALKMNEYMEQNLMFADREGNIQYARVGRTPIRVEGHDWSKAVTAIDDSVEWKGIHSVDDLVQIKNPTQGYMQNCNISPGMMMENSPMTPDKYLPYIYNAKVDQMNTRGTRARNRLAEDDSISREDAMSIAFDVYDVLAEAWQNALKAAVQAQGADDVAPKKVQAAIERILQWDGQFLKESKGAPIVRFWRAQCYETVDIESLVAGRTLSADDHKALLKGVEDALAAMKKLYGKKDVTWGDIHKVGRSGDYVACDGGVLGRGPNRTRTLLNVAGKEIEEGSGIDIAFQGSMSMVLMFFHEDGIESYTCVPWGQNENADSPHHMDQGKELYSQRKFKQVWNSIEELLPHVESKVVLKTM